MGKRNRTGTRSAPVVAVKARRPWGLYLVSGALGVALVAVLGYAVANTGSASAVAREHQLLVKPEIDGVAPFMQQEAAHLPSDDAFVAYQTYPPMGGRHSPRWQNCGAYTEPVKTERAVHSMEHGAVWISYRPNLPVEDVETLFDTADRDPYVLVAPAAEEQDGLVVLTAWGTQLSVNSVKDKRIRQFINTYASGPQTQEKGGACSGGVGSNAGSNDTNDD